MFGVIIMLGLSNIKGTCKGTYTYVKVVSFGCCQWPRLQLHAGLLLHAHVHGISPDLGGVRSYAKTAHVSDSPMFAEFNQGILQDWNLPLLEAFKDRRLVCEHGDRVTYRYNLLSSQPRQLPAPEDFTSLACWQDLGDSSTFPSRAPSLTLVDRKTLWMKCSAHCNWDVPATCQCQIAKAGEPWPMSLRTLHAWDPNADLNNGNLNFVID